MRRYGSRRNDNDIGHKGGVPVALHGEKSSRARAKREIDPDDMLLFTCRVCERRLGDFFYVPASDCCAECAGVEFPP